MLDCQFEQTSYDRLNLDCPQGLPGLFDSVSYVAVHVLPWVALAIVLLLIAKGGVFVVEQQTKAIVERFGRFKRAADPGLNFKIPIVDRIAAIQELRIEQLMVRAETKTKDNVFVSVTIAVQNRVLADKAADSWYQLDDPDAQIKSLVLDVVRAKVPNMSLDDVFEKKSEIAEEVAATLAAKMLAYGYEIEGVMVTEIDPASDVKEAMNAIQTQQRLQVAATAKGEANKILVVKNAEAEAESKRLQGEGIAAQRTAIATGLKDAVKMVAEASGVNPQEVLMTVMLTQYLDTMKEIGVSSGSKVILLPHSPAGMGDLMSQIRDSMIASKEA